VAAKQAAPVVAENAERAVGWWLLGCSGMVFGAVILGKVFFFKCKKIKFKLLNSLLQKFFRNVDQLHYYSLQVNF